ncbi:MAG: hypothetical protein HY925_04055 [Elusimicrobia bacterium]|nr:hypothetical protein [Elusimicrobiota bacterium]
MRSISLAVLIALAACGRRTSEPLRGELDVMSNTQGEFRDLRIGVANIREAEYADETGAKAKGLVAMMRVYVREKPAENVNLTVHQGQTVAVSGYALKVDEIRKDKNPGVRLSIEAPGS